MTAVIVRVFPDWLSVPGPGNRDFQSCAAGTNKNSGKHSQFLLNSVNSVKYRKTYFPSIHRFESLVNYLAWKLEKHCCIKCDCWKLEMLNVFLSWYFLQVSWWQVWHTPGALDISMNTDANWPGPRSGLGGQTRAIKSMEDLSWLWKSYILSPSPWFAQGPSDGVWTSSKDWLADCFTPRLHHNTLSSSHTSIMAKPLPQ